MILTIWRHGQAESAAVDSERELTATGRDDISFGCDCFHRHCAERGLPLPESILHSRWMRTAQTADIIGRQLPRAALASAEPLIPGSPVSGIDPLIQPSIDRGTGHLLLVSHQPLVSALVEYYLGAPSPVAALVPGGFAVLQLEIAAAGCAQLVFSAQPPEYRAQY